MRYKRGLASRVPRLDLGSGMSKNTSIATLRMVAGHPALALANTVVSRRGRFGPDLLLTHTDLVDWAVRAGVLSADEADGQRRTAQADPEAAAAVLEQARDLREAIYRLFSAVAASAEPPAEDLAFLSETARRASGQRALSYSQEGCFSWRWEDADALDAVSLRVAYTAADLLAGGDRDQLERIKECFGPNCGWLFLDTSRNGHRRWCTDEDCGVPARVREHRARRRRSAVACEAV